MARQERPVDPADGPLQAMAHELRKLRVEAGSPTYRTLARRSGYSASTLSEAASGRRKPSLDVLLAYIGALHGDQDEWRRRWEEIEDPPLPPAATPAAGLKTEPPDPSTPATTDLTAEPPDPSSADPSSPATTDLTAGPTDRPTAGHPTTAATTGLKAEPADRPAETRLAGRRARPGRLVAVAGAVVVVLLAVGAAALKLVRNGEPAAAGPATRQGASPGCPAAAPGAVFFARTYGSGTTIRQGPARVEHPIMRVPAGCTIGLTGYCVGEPIIDSTAYTPDVRWFMVAGGGVLSSATVHGNPPPGTPPSHCPHDRPLPTAITLHIGKGTLTAEGRNVEVVGYAAFYDGAWHQIGLAGPGHGDFATPWKPVKATVAAAACLGGQSPTGVVDLRAYPAGGGVSRLPEAQRKAAGQVACLYPTAK